MNLRSAEAARQAGKPEINAIGRELEALRIDVMRGDPVAALPEIEARLARVRAWCQRGQAGETVAEAPDRIYLGRVLVGALNIAWQANLGLNQWQACLDLVEEQESAERDLGEGELGLAEILALDDFAALRRFLDDHGVDREALQSELDRLVEQAHAKVADGPSDQMPRELAQLLEPILAAAQSGEDIEPLLTALGEQLIGMGADESQTNATVDTLRTAASQAGATPE